MSTTNVIMKLPTGAKVALQPYSAGKKHGHAVVHPDTGKWSGFGVVAPAAAAHLPAFVEIDGTRVDLVSDESKAGKPRVTAHNAPLPDGRRAIVRMVDEGDGYWNYVVEVNPPAPGGKGRQVTNTSLFS